MAAEGGKYRPIEDNAPKANDGDWGEVVHDCILPNREQIEEKRAARGSVWNCTCGRKWTLALTWKNHSDGRGRSNQKILTWIDTQAEEDKD